MGYDCSKCYSAADEANNELVGGEEPVNKHKAGSSTSITQTFNVCKLNSCLLNIVWPAKGCSTIDRVRGEGAGFSPWIHAAQEICC